MSDLNICTSALQGGPDNSSKPFVWLKLESINNFDDPATVKTLTPQIYQFLQSELQFEKVCLLSSYPLPFPYPVHWYKIFFILCRIGLFWPFTSWRRPTWPTRARPWQRDKPLVQREGKTRDDETTTFISTYLAPILCGILRFLLRFL